MPRTRPRRGAQTALFERNMPPTAAAHNAEGSPGRTGSTRDPARAGPRNLMAERVKLAPARVDDGLDAPRVCMQTPSRPRVWPGDDLFAADAKHVPTAELVPSTAARYPAPTECKTAPTTTKPCTRPQDQLMTTTSSLPSLHRPAGRRVRILFRLSSPKELIAARIK